MSLLASLVFALAAIVAIAALRSTIQQFADVAMGNIAALRDCSVSREYRVQTLTVVARSGSASVRRIAARAPAARRVRPLAGLRAAA